MNNEDIKKAVLSMDEEILNVDKVNKLVKLVPTPEEVSQMQQYEGDVNDLAECEKFFYQFVKIENIVERLQMWSYKMTFEEVYSDHKKKS